MPADASGSPAALGMEPREDVTRQSLDEQGSSYELTSPDPLCVLDTSVGGREILSNREAEELASAIRVLEQRGSVIVGVPLQLKWVLLGFIGG